MQALLIASTLPDYPDWPAPARELSGEETGKIYYPTHSPYDLEGEFDVDVPFAPPVPFATSGTIRLFADR